MNLTKISVRRPVTTFMGILIVLVFGALSIMNINVDMMPDMNIPIVVVSTTYDGAGAYEIESLITEPLESALGTVSGVDNISSQSNNGSSAIIIEFVDGTDIDVASLDVRDRLALVEDFLPDNASDPMLIKLNINDLSGTIVMSVTSQSSDLVALQTLTEDTIIPKLKTVAGVADVSSTGGLEKEISITLQPDKLRGFGLNETTIQQMLMMENLNLPAGSIKQGDKDMTIRIDGEFKSVDDMKNLPLTTPNGQTLFLREVATVEENFKDVKALSYTNGEPSITLNISKQSTANTVDVSTNLHKEINKITTEHDNISLNMVQDPADYIQNSLSNTIQSAMFGIIFATIILYIFLRDIKVTLVVAIAMPLSIVATFILMNYTGITLNMLSLGGLTLGVGMLVDNSIVVIESIFRKIEEGENSVDAALDGSREVSLSIISSTLTTIVVFLPLTFAGGLVSEMFNELSFTIAFSLLSSLVVALTFVPMMSALLFKDGLNKSTNKLSEKFDTGFNKFTDNYGKILSASLSKRKTTYVITVIFTVVVALSFSRINITLMPDMDEGSILITSNYPAGTLFNDAVDISSKMVENIEDLEEAELINVSVNGEPSLLTTSPLSTSIYVLLSDKQDRDRSAREIATDVENRLSNIAGADITVSASSNSTGGMSESTVAINVYGAETEVLEKIAYDLTSQFNEIEGTGIATNSLSTKTDLTNIKINRNKASSYGLTSNSVTSILSTAIDGTKATTYKVDGNEYDVTLKYDATNIEYLNDLNNVLIPSPYGISVPLYEIADIELAKNPSTVTRENQQRYVTVSVPPSTSDMNTVQSEVESIIESYDLPDGYTWSFSGNSEQMQEMFGSLVLALLAALLLVYMVMAANFESLVYPFIVMFSIPMAISGAFFGLFLISEPLTITSFIGLIMLSGIVINNAIVLIDYTNILMTEQGMNVVDALILAGKTRIRPILMSTLTTILGLLPMATSNNMGSEMLSGLSTTVISGLIFSTAITLILIPTIYLSVYTINETRRKKRKARLQKKKEKKLQNA